MFDDRNLFDQPVKNYIRTYDDIKKITTGNVEDYTTNSLLDYPCFKEIYKMTAKDKHLM